MHDSDDCCTKCGAKPTRENLIVKKKNAALEDETEVTVNESID